MRVILLDSGLQPLSIAKADLGLPWNWHIGPASTAPSNPLTTAARFSRTGVVWHLSHPRNSVCATKPMAISPCAGCAVIARWRLTDVPLSETADAYDLEILNGPAAVCTISNLTDPASTRSARWVRVCR